MGLLDDAASAISTRSKKSRSHKSHRSHKDHSRSRSRSPGRRHSSHAASSVVGGGFGGIAASIFGGGSDDEDRHHHHKKSHHSTSRSFFGGDDYKKHSASRSSFFGLGGGSGGGRSPSYYKRSPRPNFVSRVIRRLKRLLRDLIYYAKRHPLKVFMLVIMPLITGGFLTALLAKFGLRLPASITKMLGLATKAATGDSIGLVGEAVRMASGAGLGSGLGGGLAKASVSVERGRDGSMSWEKRHIEKDMFGGSGGGGGGGWGNVGGGLMGIAKMFS